MSYSTLLFLLPLLLLFRVKAQSTLAAPNENSQDAVSNFQPSLAFVIGVLCIMFAVTLLLLLYAKFCHGGAATRADNRPGLVRSASRFSGIDKTVVESLPFFRFSSLKGAKEGLECAVCLSKFEDIEILRLLPQCKHAFHISCVDQWLEKHSSCPLCRQKVNADDPAVFTYSNSFRFLWSQSERQDDSNVELFVQREESHRGSSRFSIGNSFRKVEKGDIEADSLIHDAVADDDDQKIMHKHNHQIIVSDVVFKNRWSNVSSSDLMFLNSKMVIDASSNRFSSLDSNDMQLTEAKPIQGEQMVKIKEEIEMKRLFESKFSATTNNSASPASSLPSTSDSTMNSSHTSKIMDSTDRRSVSEIIGFSRFKSLSIKNANMVSSSNDKEEKMRQIWLPIARRTVQWYGKRQTRSQYEDNTKQTSPV